MEQLFNLKRSSLILVLVFIIQSCSIKQDVYAGNLKTVNLKQFGFNGNGRTNNSDAFIKLSKWLEGKHNIQIVFPKGTYIVGKQVKVKNSYLGGSYMLRISKCKNIVIDGNNATFKYANNLKYGSFNPLTGMKYVSKKKLFTDRSYRANLGSFFMVTNSSNITISNFRLNGNSSNLKIGGRWGDAGIQLDHTGIKIIEARDVKIQDCRIEHFGLDAIYIHNKTANGKNSPNQKIRIDNVKCLHSGRQGLSWTGGSGLKVTNSEFSYTAQGAVSTAPGAGLDIEPHKGITCVNGFFQNCKFIENATSGFISDSKGYRLIYNITFDKCYFKAGKKSAIFPRNGGITISNSQIIGPCIGFSGHKGNKSKMINCYLTDSLVLEASPKYLYFFHADKKGYFSVENCIFSLHRLLPAHIASNANTESAQPYLKSNTFILNYKKAPLKPWVAILRNLILEDNTFIDKTGSNSGYKMYLNTKTGKVPKNKYFGTNKIISNNEFGWGKTTGYKAIKNPARK